MVWTVVLTIAGGLIVFDLIVHVASCLAILPFFDRKLTFSVEHAAPNLEAEPVEFPTTNELTLRGALYRRQDGPSRGMIVFCPELSGNHWSAAAYCRGLLDAGFELLAFDFRNQGESDSTPDYEPRHWVTRYEVEDALSAIRFARSLVKSSGDDEPARLGIVGISRGGGAALAAAARSPYVACVSAEGAFGTIDLSLHYTVRWATLYIPRWAIGLIPKWHLRITLQLVGRISQWRNGVRYANLDALLPRLKNRRILMIAGEDDTYVHPGVTGRLANLAGLDDDDFWVVPRARHNGSRRVDADEYDRRMVELFSHLTTSEAAEQESNRATAAATA